MKPIPILDLSLLVAAILSLRHMVKLLPTLKKERP